MANATLGGYSANHVNNTITVNVTVSHNGVNIDLAIPISPSITAPADILQAAQDWLRDRGQDLTSVVVAIPDSENDAVVASSNWTEWLSIREMS